MRRFAPALAVTLLLLLAAPSRGADDPIVYRVGLDRPQTQMVRIEMRIPDVRSDALTLHLPVWRPGRYEILDFASGVRNVSARDASTGDPRPVAKTEKSTWVVATGGADTIDITYDLYANEIGDRTRHVDDTHAFLSGSSVFMYTPARRNDPLIVEIDAPDGWRIATGLEPVAGRDDAVRAPNYDVLVDSPLEIGLHDRFAFEYEGRTHEVVAWPPGRLGLFEDQLLDDLEAIVRTQTAIFESAPYERYVFLIHIGGGGGGGTEHLNSTIMQTGRGTFENRSRYQRFLGLASHEMFHTWNVKSLRPAGIHPYDYQGENYTTLLWVAEGTTSYYDDLTLARAELISADRYLDMLGGQLAAVRTRPGGNVQNLEMSSFDAWVKYNHRSPDDVNSETSFYSRGAQASFLIDLFVRRASEGRASLDDVMRDLYKRFPLSGPGFTAADFEQTVSAFARADATPLFDAVVRGTGVFDYTEALDWIGLELVQTPRERTDRPKPDDDGDGEGDDDGDDETDTEAPEDAAYLGLDLRDDDGRTMVRSVRADGPAYEAGINAGDEIVAINRRRLSAGELRARLRRLDIGEPIRLSIFRRDELREIFITPIARADASWKLRRVKDPTDAQRANYESWMGRAWPE